jgi:hypothetical protein
MTVDAYVKQLIADDLKLERLAKTKSFAEVAEPFQKALAGLSEDDLNELARPAGSRNSNGNRKQ